MIYALLAVLALFAAGCGQAVQQERFALLDRQCVSSKTQAVVTVACLPGTAEVLQPVAAGDKDEGSWTSIFQDFVDLKIFQPTFIEGSGITLFGGGVPGVGGGG